MDDFFSTHLYTIVVFLIFNYAAAKVPVRLPSVDHDEDSKWLESILAAPRARFNQKHHYKNSNDVNKRSKLLEDFLFSNEALDELYRRFATSMQSRNGFSSYRRRRSWIEDDAGNRATDTTPSVAPTTSSTIPTSTTTTTTAMATTAGGRKNNIPQFPSFPGWSPPWSPPSWPFSWGKRRRRALISNRNFEMN